MCIAAKVLLIARQVILIGKKEFVVAAFDLENKAFVVYIAFIS